MNRLKVALPAAIVCVLMALAFATPKNPHKDLEFSCEECHSTASFEEVRFDHSRTGYELSDRHQEADCKGCHEIERFTVQGYGCANCHTDVHEAKLGPNCTRCHTPQSWRIFDVEEIHMASEFPFSGKHALLDCEACHPGLPQIDIGQTTNRCIGCHQQAYLETTNPNHVSAGFSTECQDCHELNTWRPARVNDHDQFFPIFSGVHSGIWTECATCHITPGNFSEFSCFNCHGHPQSKSDADHVGMPGYSYNSQACYECHPDGRSSLFLEHDAQFFPIYSGTHSNQWENCVNCHTNPAAPTEFDCTVCHTNPETDNAHTGMTGYAYNSPDCFRCHPDGRAGKFTDHDAQFFPIYSGTHLNQWDDCSSCHDNPANPAQFNCLNCHTDPQTSNFHQGIPGYAYNSPDCLRCHSDGKAGKFVEHDDQFFPIFSGKHNRKWNSCGDCHNVTGQRSVFTCVEGCHKHPQSKMNDKHKNMNGYQPNGTICITCHPDGRK